MKFFSKNKTEGIDLDLNNIPKHIGIIMDGNGRWAKKRGLPRSMGHKAGVEAIREIVKECSRLGVKYLTIYAFSTENWKRPKDEVNTLMSLLADYLKNEFEELNKNNVIINHLGSISKLPQICQNELVDAYEKTKKNTGLTLNLALNYGGRQEIIEAVKKIAAEKSQDEITEDNFKEYLYTKGIPDPDLIIRSSGEMRLSNFLIWQSAYSEFWVSDINWPDFRKENLQKAIWDYQRRDRRYGGIK
ncbi:MAG: isoprenyl transferase [Clostridiaceae bacterium]